MSDYEIGFGKPPRSGRFKPGASGNPRGRPKRKPLAASEIICGVLNTPIKYRERGKTKVATRQELALKLLVDGAVAGDTKAAEDVLKARIHAQRSGEAGSERLEISDWLPDYAGQTGEQKTKDLLGNGVAGNTELGLGLDSDQPTVGHQGPDLESD